MCQYRASRSIARVNSELSSPPRLYCENIIPGRQLNIEQEVRGVSTYSHCLLHFSNRFYLNDRFISFRTSAYIDYRLALEWYNNSLFY